MERIDCQMMMDDGLGARTFGGPQCGAEVPEARQPRGPWLCDQHRDNPYAPGTINALRKRLDRP